MNISHPSEREIQDYVLDKSGCAQSTIEHIESCEHCRAAITTYRLLFSEIQEQPSPAFEFDLSALVLAKLPSAPAPLPADRFVAGFLIFFICFCVAVPVYLLRKYFLNLFTDLSSFFIYSIIISTIIIMFLKALGMYKKYQKQMHFLNYN